MTRALALLTLVFVASCVDEQTCAEKAATFTCARDGDRLSCDDANDTADPVCVCDGDFAVSSDRCRLRDYDACCACLAADPGDGGPCASDDDAGPGACAGALRAGGAVVVAPGCAEARCADPCWFVVERTTTP